MEFFGRYIEVTPHSRLVWTNDESDDGGRHHGDLRGKGWQDAAGHARALSLEGSSRRCRPGRRMGCPRRSSNWTSFSSPWARAWDGHEVVDPVPDPPRRSGAPVFPGEIHLAGRAYRQLRGRQAADQVQAHVDPRGDAGGRHQAPPSSIERGPSSTRTAGKSRRSSSASSQCVVARRPSSRPAAASSSAPVHTDAVNRARVAVAAIQAHDVRALLLGADDAARHHQHVDAGWRAHSVRGRDRQAAAREHHARLVRHQHNAEQVAARPRAGACATRSRRPRTVRRSRGPRRRRR